MKKVDEKIDERKILSSFNDTLCVKKGQKYEILMLVWLKITILRGLDEEKNDKKNVFFQCNTGFNQKKGILLAFNCFNITIR